MGFLPGYKANGKSADELAWLEQSAVGFGICVRQDAARFHELLLSERDAWLRRRGKHLPSPAQRERELYARPYRKEVRHG
jgi:hypothetical protein